EAAKVNDIIAIVGPEGTDVTPLLNQPAAAPKAEAKSQEKAPEASTTSAPAVTTTTSSSDDSRVKASPLARKIAKEKGINLKDVENFVPAAKTSAAPAQEAKAETKTISLPTFVGEEKYTESNVSQMRKTIARRLGESLFTAPHFYLTVSIDMDNAIAARTQIN